MHPTDPHRHNRHVPRESRAIPPHGDVSPDGQRPWPHPSLTSRILVVGGAAVMAAAATAAAVMATRRIAGLIAGGDEEPVARPHLAPRYAEMDEDEREEVRRRMRARARADANHAARARAEAARERHPPRRNAAQGLTDTATQLSGSLNGVMGALTGAVAGFRSVATQAGGIVRDFAEAADTVRSFLDNRPSGQTRRDTERKPRTADSQRTDKDDDRRLHSL